MYVGRIVSVGRTRAGRNSALYRVSSRSFPNRKCVELGGKLAVLPREGHEGDVHKNPYIAYNCLRVAGSGAAGQWAIATNGTQTDPIAEKIDLGMPVRDAFSSTLLALDFEKDDYSTPRIAAAVPLEGDTGWLGIVRSDALVVKSIPLEAGAALYLATYEADDICDEQRSDFDADDALGAARFAVHGGRFGDLTNPVTSAAAMAGKRGFELGTFVVE